MGSLSDVTEAWWDAGGIFACPDTDRCQNREEHSPLAIHTAAFVHALVLLAAGLVLCYEESINLTYDMNNGRFNAHSERRGSKYLKMLTGGSYGFWLSKI